MLVDNVKNLENMFLIYRLLLRKTCPYSEFCGPYFPAVVLNTERFSVSLRILSKCGKMRTRKTYTGTYHTVYYVIHPVSNTLCATFSIHEL